MNRRVWQILMLLGAVQAVLIASTGTATAACSGPYGSNFAGAYSGSSTDNRGARADIAVPATKPGVCNDDDFTDPWTMIVDNSGHLAQIGFGMDWLNSSGLPRATTPRYIGFTQFTTQAGNPYSNVYTGPPTGTTRTFTNVYRTSDHHIHMLENSVQYSETGYDPVGVWGASWHGEFFNETGHLSDAKVWGTSGDKLVFTEVQRYINSAWDYSKTLTKVNDNQVDWNVNLFTPTAGGQGIRVWNN